jgi:hypothetical protein
MKPIDFDDWFWANMDDIIKRLYLCLNCDDDGKVTGPDGEKENCPRCKGENYYEKFHLEDKAAETLEELYAQFTPVRS